MSQKIKHLEFLVATIARLAGHSFQLKGWSVVVVSALFAISASTSQSVFVLLAAIPALVFWGLDGFYLATETAYRTKYDDVRRRNEDNIDFDMSLPYGNVGYGEWASALGSRTVFPFHGAIIIAVVVVATSLR